MVEIDDVLSIDKPIRWQVLVSNLIPVTLWLVGMALLFRVLDVCTNTFIRLIYG